MYALVDCNNFYVSCERVFDPKLRNRPVAILSSNDGCVIARSNEVKALGIAMGEPAFRCTELFKKHNVAVLSSNFALYADLSSRVMRVLESFDVDVQIYSIDEAFLHFTQRQVEHNNLMNYATTLRQTVLQHTGIPISIGIAATKTLTKVANKQAKKMAGGIVGIFDEPTRIVLLKHTPVNDVWGVGGAYTALLKRYGILTALALTQRDDVWIKKHMTIGGLRMVWELRGISCITDVYDEPTPKSIIRSRSFGRPVLAVTELKEAIAVHAARAAEKLRQDGLCATMMQVYMSSNRFSDAPYYSNSVSVQLQPTCYTPTLIAAATLAVEQMYRPGYRYKKCGVMVSGLVPESEKQAHLFVPSDTNQTHAMLMQTVDKINARYGSNTVFFAAMGTQRPWGMKRNKISQAFTTKWEELAIARIG